jgi:V/A-type H+-transporting ATPase subunit D
VAGALASALARHGLQGLQCYPAGDPLAVRVGVKTRSLLGVALQDARVLQFADRIPAPVVQSPEAEYCRDTYTALASHLVAMAAMSGNLERLYREYRRSVRRTRALQDVLLPELDRTINDIEARLEELEQDEALWIRQRRRWITHSAVRRTKPERSTPGV